MSQEQVARLMGKSQSAIANKLRLLRHSDRVLESIRQQGLSERHARALLRLESEPEELSVIDTVARLNMSVARTEKYIEDLLSGRECHVGRVNVGSFLNNLHNGLQRIQLSGIPAVSERRETESQIVVTITIPK
jgi:ParB family chromosome partitioning protein